MAMRLPPTWQKRIRSDYLKEQLVDYFLWTQIPGVDPDMGSARGRRRLKESEALFAFVDTYFPEGPFAIEPNMHDGRFMLIPDEFYHQGMAICASLRYPGALEVGHFWYPRDFSTRVLKNDPDQLYADMFTTIHDDVVAEMARSILAPGGYTVRPNPKRRCDFPFFLNLTVTLEGPFLNDVGSAVRTVKEALRDQSEQIRRNGSGLTMFMKTLARDQGW